MTDPERIAYLWREYVYQAVRDLVLKNEATEAERMDARVWIASRSAEPGSFLWACAVAGLDPAEVRDVVREREAKPA